MKPLADTYKKNGYIFHLVERDGDVAIYSQNDPDSGKTVAYEVFEVQKNEERVISGVSIPASESVPSNESWGKKGYTLWSLELAHARKREIIARIANRQNNPI